MKKLYVFDFDGTLTYKDTMFLYLKYFNPSKYRFQFLKHAPLFALVKLKLADAETVKKSFIASILKGQTETKLNQVADQFFEHQYPKLIRDNALDFIDKIKKEHTDSYIVTASLDIWVRPFAEKFGMQLLATKADYQNGVFTGNFATKNCNGEEKVVRIKEAISGRKFDKTIAFGDTSGDKPMLKWANESFYQFFH
ncbi:HAD family hydrolase [Soonwooa sp.]|uniref:HAD family hydrolase n=1 Tax=Soonwooa sp. TaxID=1938592 RepID=UPI0028A95E16|nr:HAD family hydrolase [Soonwooa sp.]